MSDNSGNNPPVEVDIAVLGAGMVGASLVAALEGFAGRIAIIDAQQPVQSITRNDLFVRTVESFDPRVSALTLASQALLKKVGAWPHLDPAVVQNYRKMIVWDGMGTAQVRFDAAELHCHSLGAIIENREIVAALQAVLAKQANLTTCYQSPVANITPVSQGGAGSQDDGHIVHFSDGQRLQAKLLVAADGANSFVRQRFGLPTREWDYGHQAIVCTVETEASHDQTAWQRFDESGPLAFLPLPAGEASSRFSSIVWSLETDQAKRTFALSDDAFAKQLECTFESRLGRVIAVSPRHMFPLRQRHAKSYLGPSLVLVGDAAHTIHPLAGQGVNQGLKDVSALADILLDARGQGIEINHPLLLKRYQRMRQGDNLMMMGVMEGFKRLFGTTNPVLRLVRNSGMRWFDQQSLIKSQIARQAMGLDSLAE